MLRTYAREVNALLDEWEKELAALSGRKLFLYALLGIATGLYIYVTTMLVYPYCIAALASFIGLPLLLNYFEGERGCEKWCSYCMTWSFLGFMFALYVQPALFPG